MNVLYRSPQRSVLSSRSPDFTLQLIGEKTEEEEEREEYI